MTRSALSAAIDTNPLRQAGILEHVLSYVGPGHWLFLSTVCGLWLEVYAKLSSVEVAEATADSAYEATFTCTPQVTLISSAFASPSRVRLAHELGLNIALERNQFAAGSHADVDTLVAAHELGMQYTSHTLLGAARAGAAYKLVWLYTMCGTQNLQTTMMIACEAAKAGSVTALGWLNSTQHGPVFGSCTATAAAQHNQLSTLQYLRSEGCAWNGYVLSAAARNGALGLLRWAQEHGCPWDEFGDEHAEPSILAEAACGGSIELLRWLQQKLPHLECDEQVMCAAAEGGHVAMCQHLRANGCAWSIAACQDAAAYDRVGALRWLRDNGCPFDAAAVGVVAAASGDSLKVMAYLLAEGLLSPELLTKMLNLAGATEHLAAVQWLRQHGAEWPAVLRYTVLDYHGEVLH
jgi:hypothetical protein